MGSRPPARREFLKSGAALAEADLAFGRHAPPPLLEMGEVEVRPMGRELPGRVVATFLRGRPTVLEGKLQ